MKDVFDIKKAVKGIISSALSSGSISARIFDGRPKTYKGNYIVVAHVSTTNETLQDSVLYVRIHVPNLVMQTEGVTDNSQPDIATLEAISKVVTPALDDIQSGDYAIFVEWAPTIENEPDLNEHYVSIRLNVKIINN